jgi:hypothetical protein
MLLWEEIFYIALFLTFVSGILMPFYFEAYAPLFVGGVAIMLFLSLIVMYDWLPDVFYSLSTDKKEVNAPN